MSSRIIILCALFLLTSCVQTAGKELPPVEPRPQAQILEERKFMELMGLPPIQAPRRIADQPLIVIGEGGSSGFLFQYVADTYVKEHGGQKYTVHDGDEFVAAMRDFAAKFGAISQFVYIGHGNDVGLYVNQAPHINGALYVNDPAVDTPYRAASIYELPSSIFAKSSTSIFYGCNIARTRDESDSFAEQFANHFQTTVKAATGPTEFSFEEDGRDFLKAPVAMITQPLYMVPTADDKGFIETKPAKSGIGGFADVYESMQAAPAIADLRSRGLALGGSGTSFLPYQSISLGDAQYFCRVIDVNAKCVMSELKPDERLRNTAALKLLLESAGIVLKKTRVPYQAQIAFALKHNLLTADFLHRRWYSRAEMAILTQNILQYKETL